MQQPKLGGKPQLRIFLFGNEDLTSSLLSLSEGGLRLDGGLRDRAREKFHGRYSVELTHLPYCGSDFLLAQLGMRSIPEDFTPTDQFEQDPWVAARRGTGLFESQPDVVVLSVLSDITTVLWKHRWSGYLWCPPPGWKRVWDTSRQKRFVDEFVLLGLTDVSRWEEHMVRVIAALKARLNAHVIIYNCSSVDPQDMVHNYHGLDETLALRIHKFNHALVEISAMEGISIIDVDRLLAELGGEQHVFNVGQYSAEACAAIREEFIRVLDDIGFFEPRPLVMQLGQR